MVGPFSAKIGITSFAHIQCSKNIEYHIKIQSKLQLPEHTWCEKKNSNKIYICTLISATKIQHPRFLWLFHPPLQNGPIKVVWGRSVVIRGVTSAVNVSALI